MVTLDERKQIVLDLVKNIGLEGQKAEVKLALDFSGSMDSLYRGGKVQELVERLLPLGLAFDDNGEVDFYLFDDGVKKVPATLNRTNLTGYINKQILGKYSMGGTNYAPVINKIVADCGGGAPGKSEKKGFLGSLFSKKESVIESLPNPFKYPTYVMFITDGANGDKAETEAAIINASKYGIFFQFVGIGGASFPFLEKLDDLDGRVIDNANFFKVNDLSKATDAELYKLLLTEFPSWIPQARTAKQIV